MPRLPERRMNGRMGYARGKCGQWILRLKPQNDEMLRVGGILFLKGVSS